MDGNHSMINESGGSNGSTPVSSSTNSIPVDKKIRKSIRPRSTVWEHFEKYIDSNGASKARCNYCSSSYSADTSFNDGKVAGALTTDDWTNIRNMEKFLETFFNLTLRVSGSLYVTSNVHFHEIGELSCVLNVLIESDDFNFRMMAKRMKTKFDKYWGAPEKMNKMIFVACVLDPRFKFDYVAFVFLRMYGKEKGEKMGDEVKSYMISLFDEYRKVTSNISRLSSTSSNDISDISSINSGKTHQGTLIQQEYLRYKTNSGRMDAKTELDKYLGEETEVANNNFDILLWWKVNSPRFPVLAEMARNVLAIPVSTVASESAFSTGGRVLDSFRSSLTPKLVQTLVCLQDWLRKETSHIKIEEDLENLERLESNLINNGRDSCIVDI